MPDANYGYFYNRTYLDRFAQWGKLRDSFAGNERVKDAGAVYLPEPGGLTSTQYSAYKTRALFYPVIERTLRGLLGCMFRIKPTFKLPARMAPMVEATTPEGDGLVELARVAAHEVLLMGRHGLLVDFPEAAASDATPYVVQYVAENITNWERHYINGALRLTKVFVRDSQDSDGPNVERILELWLDYRTDEAGRLVGDAVYRCKVWTLDVDHKSATAKPRGAPRDITPSIAGRTLSYIPFYFIGPMSNKVAIEKSPMLDLADANLAHYRMDADYKHALYMVAQPTPYIMGDIEDNKIPKRIGAAAFWVLPSTVTDVGMLEYSGAGIESIARALDKIEGYMAALGAKLIHRQTQPETAEAVKVRARDELSVIESVAQSVQEALDAALSDAAEWLGQSRETVEVQMNSDFAEGKLDPAMLQALVKSWQDGAISREVYHQNLQRGEIMPPNRTVEEEREAIEEEQEAKAAAAPAPTQPAVPGQPAPMGEEPEEESDEDAEDEDGQD